MIRLHVKLGMADAACRRRDRPRASGVVEWTRASWDWCWPQHARQCWPMRRRLPGDDLAPAVCRPGRHGRCL